MWHARRWLEMVRLSATVAAADRAAHLVHRVHAIPSHVSVFASLWNMLAALQRGNSFHQQLHKVERARHRTYTRLACIGDG